MIICSNCKISMPNDIAVCARCGFDFETGLISEGHRAAALVAPIRPDGKKLLGLGTILIGIGIAFFVISIILSGKEYGETDLDSLFFSWSLTLTSFGLIHIGVLIWLAGYISFAISFLPSKE